MKNALVYGVALAAIVGVGFSFANNLSSRSVPTLPDLRGIVSRHTETALSGKTAEERRVVAPFTRIELNGSGQVELSLGGEEAVVVSADEAALSFVETEVRDGVLVLGVKHGAPPRLGSVRYAVSAKSVDELKISGSGDVKVTGTMTGESVRFLSDGSGDLSAAVELAKAEVRIRGSGDVELSGRAGALDIGIFGSGNVDAEELSGDAVDANVAGSGSVELGAFGTVNAKIAGSGDVVYKGSAKVSSQIFGSGKVRSRD